MAVVEGTSAGFVTTAPTADPSAGSTFDITNTQFAMKFTSPATAIKITELGWWCSEGTAETLNVSFFVYDHNGGTDLPNNQVDGGTDALSPNVNTWIRKTGLDITISPSTIYWLTAGMAQDAGDPGEIGREVTGGRLSFDSFADVPADPWSSSGTADRLYAIYAVWEAAAVSGGGVGM